MRPFFGPYGPVRQFDKSDVLSVSQPGAAYAAEAWNIDSSQPCPGHNNTMTAVKCCIKKNSRKLQNVNTKALGAKIFLQF